MAKGISEFKSSIGAGFARPSLFSVEIVGKGVGSILSGSTSTIRSLSLLCNSAIIPGLNMVTTETSLDYRAKVKQKVYDDISLSFFCTEDMAELHFFQEWMESMVNPVTNRVGFYDSYVRNITINKLNLSSSSGEETSGVDIDNYLTLETVLHDAYPKRIDPIAMDYSSKDSIMTMNVSFGYRNYVQDWKNIVVGV